MSLKNIVDRVWYLCRWGVIYYVCYLMRYYGTYQTDQALSYTPASTANAVSCLSRGDDREIRRPPAKQQKTRAAAGENFGYFSTGEDAEIGFYCVPKNRLQVLQHEVCVLPVFQM